MRIYIVVQDGVYRHDIFLTTDDEKKAIEYADELHETDVDGYHSYQVVQTTLNVKLDKDKDRSGYGHWGSDEKLIYETKRN